MNELEKFGRLTSSYDTLSVKELDGNDLSDSSLSETVVNSKILKHQDTSHSRARISFSCSHCDYCSFNEESIKCHIEEHRQLLSYDSHIVKLRDENDSEEIKSNSSSLLETVLNVDINTRTEKLPSVDRVIFRCLSCDYYSFNEEDVTRHTNEHKDSSSSDNPALCISPQSNDVLATEKVNVDCFCICDECPYETRKFKEFTSHLNVHSWLNSNTTIKKDLVQNPENSRYFLRSRPPKVKKNDNLLTEQPTKFFCKQCQFSCDESCTLFRHQAVHASESELHRKTTKTSRKIFYCLQNYCSFFSDNLDLLKRHQEFHEKKLQKLFDKNTKKPKFNYRMCGFSYTGQKQMVRHESVNSESLQNSNISDQMIVSRKENAVEQFSSCSMPKKVKVLVKPKQNRFPCSICSAILQTEKQLKSHELSHNSFADEYKEIQRDQKIFKCKKCPNSYSSKYYLDLHQGLHGVKFKCLHCGKEYKRKPAFNRHMRICKLKA